MYKTLNMKVSLFTILALLKHVLCHQYAKKLSNLIDLINKWRR